MDQQTRPPLPPFDEETARQKVRAAQDGRSTRDPEKVALAYTEDSRWRNRDEFLEGREEIRAFLERKWARELDYRVEKNLWCFTESRAADGQWWRSHPYDRFATPSHSAAASCLGPGVLAAVAS